MIRRGGGVAALLRHLGVGRRKGAIVLTLSMYLDESGFHEGTPAMAVGGYFAADDRWTRFEEGWDRVLQSEGVEFFHMADFESRHGQFKGWSQDRRVRFLSGLIEVINEHASPGWSYGISAADYQAVVPRSTKKTPQQWMELAYVTCWGRCMREVVEAVNYRDDVSVRLIFDRNKAMAPLMLGAMQGAIEKYPEYSKWVASISFEDKKEFVPLQAADLLAYETFKLVANTFGNTPRPKRKSMAALEPSLYRVGFIQLDALADDIALIVGAKRNR